MVLYNLSNHHSANNASYTNLTELQSCFSIRNTFVIQLDKCVPTRSQARLSYAAALLNIYTTTYVVAWVVIVSKRPR